MTRTSLLFAVSSGRRPPRRRRAKRLLTRSTVADLESEAAHGFALGDAWDTDDVVGFRGAENEEERSTRPARTRARHVPHRAARPRARCTS